MARETCSKYVDKALVLVSCTGLDEVVNVSKDWGLVEEAVFDALGEDFLAVFVPFDIADCFKTE